MRSLEILTSAMNEEECLPEFFSRIKIAMAPFSDIPWKIIICDNGSNDNTWKIIQEHSLEDARITGIRLSRNFELDASLTCALDNASADAIIMMASDLQDPPEILPDLINKHLEGFDQVLVKITKRESVPYFYRVLSKFFYFIANKLTRGMLPRNVSDFKLLSKNVYQSARMLREQNRFLRGLIAWTGFSSTYIEIERPPRFGGESKFLNFGFGRAINWAINAILAHTTTPLVWISIIGMSSSALSLFVTFAFSLVWLIWGVPFAGFGTIVGIVTLGFSLILLSLGIIAQYLALIYEEVKQRPIYIISERTQVM